MLVYGVRPDDVRAEAGPFLELMQVQEASLCDLARANRTLVERTGRVLPSLDAIVGAGKMWTYPEVLGAMIRDGHAPNLTIAANLITSLGGRFNADLPIERVVGAAHEAGGICVMAHPGRPDLGPAMTAETLDKLLADAPVDGLECHYRTYTDRDTAFFRELAGRHGMVISAGSDSHGPGFPVDPRPFRAIWAKALLGRLGITVENQAEGPVWAPGMDPYAAKARSRRGTWRRHMPFGRYWPRRER